MAERLTILSLPELQEACGEDLMLLRSTLVSPEKYRWYMKDDFVVMIEKVTKTKGLIHLYNGASLSLETRRKFISTVGRQLVEELYIDSLIAIVPKDNMAARFFIRSCGGKRPTKMCDDIMYVFTKEDTAWEQQ